MSPIWPNANIGPLWADSRFRCPSYLPPLSPVAAAMAADLPGTLYQFSSTNCAAALIDRGSAGITGTVHNCPDVGIAPCATIPNAGNGMGFNILADTAQYVSMGTAYSEAASDPFSIEVWLNPRGYWYSQITTIVGKSQFRHGYNAPKIGDYLWSYNSAATTTFSICANNLLYSWSTGIPFNNCYQLVITFDLGRLPANPLVGYKNGGTIGGYGAGPDSIFGPPYLAQGATELDIAAATANLGPGLPYDGRMDFYEFAFFTYALSAAQVAAHWAAR